MREVESFCRPLRLPTKDSFISKVIILNGVLLIFGSEEVRREAKVYLFNVDLKVGEFYSKKLYLR